MCPDERKREAGEDMYVCGEVPSLIAVLSSRTYTHAALRLHVIGVPSMMPKSPTRAHEVRAAIACMAVCERRGGVAENTYLRIYRSIYVKKEEESPAQARTRLMDAQLSLDEAWPTFQGFLSLCAVPQCGALAPPTTYCTWMMRERAPSI